MNNKILNFRYIFYPFLAFFLGITLARKFYGGNLEVILLIVGLFTLLSVFLLYKKLYKILVLLLAFFLLGNGFYYIGRTSFDVKDYNGYVSVVGRVTDNISENGYSLEIILDEVKIEGNSAENVRITIENGSSGVKVGSVFAFEAKLSKSKMFTLESFNSTDYRAGVRYSATVDFDDIVVTDGYKKVDESIRLAVKNSLYEHMSEKNAGISYAVLFGDKNGLDENVKIAYQSSGIIHVLTVSGLHVGFLTSLLYFVLKLCKANKYVRLVVTTIFIIFYAYLCGFTPSVMRAGIMAMVLLLSKIFERRYDSLNSLGFAGFLICIFSPLSALDLGFQMSFFCVAGIIILARPLTKVFAKFIPYKIATLIAISLSAQIGIMPIMANFSVGVNILSVFVNLFVVPMFSVIYPFLFVVGFLSTFLPFVGYLLKLVEFVLVAVTAIAKFFGSTNLYFSTSPFKASIVTIYFLMIMAVGKFVMMRGLIKFALFSALALVLTITFGLFLIPASAQDIIVFLGNKESASVVIESKEGERLVVGESFMLSRYLSAYSIDKIDVFIATVYLSEYNFDRLAESGTQLFVGNSQNVENKNFEIFEDNKRYIVGEFMIEFVDTAGVDGVQITFAQHKIFVATGKENDYNILENMNFDLVFDDYAVANGQTFTLATIESGGEYCLEQNGNMRFSFNGQDWGMRGID